MKIPIKRINIWKEDSAYPEYIEIQVEESTVYEGPGDRTSNAFCDGFICALDAMNIDFSYEVEDIDE